MEINNCDELVNYILSLNFEGTIEEIQLQQILALDKYIKDNIDYSFETIKFSLEHPGVDNPYKEAYSSEGFFKNKTALCGGISETANLVLRKLGIKSEYIYGHFDTDLYGTKNWGHRWNKIKIGEKSYMIDFTLNLCQYKWYICNNVSYRDVDFLLKKEESQTENMYIFNKDLVSNLYFGGFRLTENGHESNLDEEGNILGLKKDSKEYFNEEISYIPLEIIDKYYIIVKEKIENRKNLR